jgi:hypothetical protein
MNNTPPLDTVAGVAFLSLKPQITISWMELKEYDHLTLMLILYYHP